MDTTQTQSENGHKKVGPIIATLVIVLILIIGALYIFASRMNQQVLPSDTTTETTTTVKTVTNTADDVNSLQNDLNSSSNGLNSQSF